MNEDGEAYYSTTRSTELWLWSESNAMINEGAYFRSSSSAVASFISSQLHVLPRYLPVQNRQAQYTISSLTICHPKTSKNQLTRQRKSHGTRNTNTSPASTIRQCSDRKQCRHKDSQSTKCIKVQQKPPIRHPEGIPHLCNKSTLRIKLRTSWEGITLVVISIFLCKLFKNLFSEENARTVTIPSSSSLKSEKMGDRELDSMRRRSRPVLRYPMASS